MFVDKTLKENPALIQTTFEFHQLGKVLPDTYIIDMDTLRDNAKKILREGTASGIDLYFMLKQVGRNPYIAKELVKLGYKGAVVVDFKEAQIMMKHHIPIANVGHLVQAPKAMLEELISYGCEYMTVFSIEKIKDIDACAKKVGKVQKLLLKVVDHGDTIYSGQTAGFYICELANVIAEIKELKNIEIQGVTSFPCFLYDETKDEIQPTHNLETLQKAKKLLADEGIHIENVNAPSTSSVATLRQMAPYDIQSGEPGHGLTGSTPLHAYKTCEEKPCVVYVSEVSHNFDQLAYCYGGGYYRRSHVKNALVGKNINEMKQCEVIPPTLESIDYYFGLHESCHVNDTVIMAFRFQMFVTRSNVCLVEGLHDNKPVIIGQYTSLGEEL